MINWLLIKYEIQLLNIIEYAQEQNIIAVFIKCLLMPIYIGTILYKGWIYYLLMLT